MRRAVLIVCLAAAAANARAQPSNPIDIAIRAAEALARTAAAAGPSAPAPTPTPLAATEPKPLEVQPDGSSVDTIVAALYAAVSHGPDSEPNWKRLRGLFLRHAIVVPPPKPGSDEIAALDVTGFEDRIRRYVAGRRERGERLGFTEREIARRENRYGAVCQVFSTYETLWSPHESLPFARGVHTIQLVSDGRRWWIASLAWDVERPDQPIPPQILAP